MFKCLNKFAVGFILPFEQHQGYNFRFRTNEIIGGYSLTLWLSEINPKWPTKDRVFLNQSSYLTHTVYQCLTNVLKLISQVRLKFKRGGGGHIKRIYYFKPPNGNQPIQ